MPETEENSLWKIVSTADIISHTKVSSQSHWSYELNPLVRHKEGHNVTDNLQMLKGNNYNWPVIHKYYSLIGIFEDLTVLEVNSTGLVHHCNQYGVTFIIPEGAVEGTATVWFGVTLLSDKFKFKDDFIPVSPIVWTYINCHLLKPAELFIPHHIDVSNLEDPDNHLFLLTADDESFLRNSVFTFKQNNDYQVMIESNLVQILASHFCSNCIAVKGNTHRNIPRKYLMAQTNKREDDCFFVDFIFLYQQKGCMKVSINLFSILMYSSTHVDGTGTIS